MATPEDLPLLREPVTPRSRVVPRVGTRYSEVAGRPVVWDTSTGVLHELSPAAAALWGSLDGRTLEEVVAAEVPDAADRPGAMAEVVEAIRRLRALGLAEDADAGADDSLGGGQDAAAPGPTMALGVPAAAVELAGAVQPSEDRSGLVLVLVAAPAVEVPQDVRAADLEVHVPSATVVELGASGADGAEGGLPLRGVAVVDPGVEGPTPLGPVALLGHLVAAVPGPVSPRLMVLDALAGLAEVLPGFAVGSADAVASLPWSGGTGAAGSGPAPSRR